MLFFDLVGALLSFDIGFFIDLVMNNPVWLFGFLVVGYKASDGKNTIVTGLIAWLVVITTMELFQPLVGISIYVASLLLPLYLGRIFVLAIVTSKKEWAKYLSIGYVLVFYLVVAGIIFWK